MEKREGHNTRQCNDFVLLLFTRTVLLLARSGVRPAAHTTRTNPPVDVTLFSSSAQEDRMIYTRASAVDVCRFSALFTEHRTALLQVRDATLEAECLSSGSVTSGIETPREGRRPPQGTVSVSLSFFVATTSVSNTKSDATLLQRVLAKKPKKKQKTKKSSLHSLTPLLSLHAPRATAPLPHTHAHTSTRTKK